MNTKKFFNALAASDGLESSENKIANIAIMTTGVALGHGLNIDRRSLETAFECVKGTKLKSFVNHHWHPDPTDIIGIFSDFEIVDLDDGISKLVARSFEFLNSADVEDKARIMELSRVAPEVFGCSLSTDCSCVWIMDDGSEVCGYDRPKGCNAESPVARFTRIVSCDFVSDPAANASGLFSTPKGKIQPKLKKDYSVMKKQIEYFNSRFADKPALFQVAVGKLAQLAEGEEVDEKKIADEVESDAQNEENKQKIAELESKVQELQKKLEEAEQAKTQAESEKAEMSAKLQGLGGVENFSIETSSASTALSEEISEWNKKMDVAQANSDIAEIQRLCSEAETKKYFN